MITATIIASCGGGVFKVTLESQAAVDARREQLDRDHVPGGPGCHWCRPPPQTRQP